MLATAAEYVAQIKEVGKYNLKDTHKWRERAIYFQEHKSYDDFLVEDTYDWDKFWDEEEKKINEGFFDENGFYIPGMYYLYLNFLPIYRKQDKKYDFPDVYDSDYHTFLCLEHAIVTKRHFGVVKKRVSGYTLKFCAALMKEVYWGHGSPNYMATYEEAQVKKAWTEILEPYRDFLNQNTPWYRDMNPGKVLDWLVAAEGIENGRKVKRGRKNSLKGLVLSKSPSKGVGGGATFIFADEAGVNPVLSKFLGYVDDMLSYGGVTTGTIIVSGAVGELKHLEGGLKEIILNPAANKFYAVENIWDTDPTYKGKMCGFFVPTSWAFYNKYDPNDEDSEDVCFIDKDGNSDVEGATAYILRKREIIKERDYDKYMFYISQNPLNLAECFQYRTEKTFPTHLINPRIAYLEAEKLHGMYVDIFKTVEGEVKHKILDKYSNKPVLDHPVTKKTNKTGVIQVWELPKPNAPYGLYWAGVDIVRDQKSDSSPSLNGIHIYKGFHKINGEYAAKKIVAKFLARPEDKMYWFEKAMLLQDWYNAEALVENNVGWYIEEAIKMHKQYRIAKTPKWYLDYAPQSTAFFTKPFGVNMTDKLFQALIDEQVAYCKEDLGSTFDDVTGEPTKHYGVERVNDLELLKEWVNYVPKKENEKGDYTSIISFGLALKHAAHNEMLGLVHEGDEENEGNSYNNIQKNGKLSVTTYPVSQNIRNLKNTLNNNSYGKRRK